jgi:hypothetical protein
VFLSQGHLNADQQRQVDMLRRRLELHDEVYNRRLKREQDAKNRTGLIKRYIGTCICKRAQLTSFTIFVLPVLTMELCRRHDPVFAYLTFS